MPAKTRPGTPVTTQKSAKVHPVVLQIEDVDDVKTEQAITRGVENNDVGSDMVTTGEGNPQVFADTSDTRVNDKPVENGLLEPGCYGVKTNILELERERTHSLLSQSLILYPNVTEGETVAQRCNELKDQQMSLRLAAAHVEDALMGRGSLGKSRAMFLSKYQKICFAVFDNYWWNRLIYIIIILHSFLAFFEPTQDHIKAGETHVVVWILDITCLIIYIIDIAIQIVLFQWKTFLQSRESRRSRVELILFILFTIDFVMFVIQEALQKRLLQPFRCVRPAMMYAKSRNFSHIFDVCASIILSLGKVLCLVFLYVLVFAVAAVHCYMNNYHGLDNANSTKGQGNPGDIDADVYEGAFDNVAIGFLRMFVMITSENYPALMIPAYRVNNANFLFFGIFIYIGIFVVTSILIARVVEKYWYYSKQHIKAERMHERAELAKAWKLLDPSGDGHVSIHDRRIWQILLYTRPKLREEEVAELVDYLDEDGDGDIDAFEWTTRLTDALNYDFIKEPAPWAVQSPKWFASMTKLCRKVVNSRAFHVLVLILISLHSVLLCLKWRDMLASTELVIHCLRTTITVLFVVELVMKILGLGTDLKDALEVCDMCCTVIGVACNLLWYLVPYVTSVPDPGTYHATLVVVSGTTIFLRLGFNSRPTKKLVESFMKLAPVLADLILFVVILIYFYAVLGMEFFYGFTPDYSIDSDHWGYECDLGFATLGCSMLEVFQICTSSNWHEIMNAVVKATTFWSAIYFVTCFCIMCLVVMNLFVAMTIEAIKHLVPTDHDSQDTNSISIQHQTFSKNALAFLDAVFAPSRSSTRTTDRKVSLAVVNERRRSMIPTPLSTYQERERHLSLGSSSHRPSLVSQRTIQQEQEDTATVNRREQDVPAMNSTERSLRRSVATKRRRDKLIKDRLAKRKQQSGNRFRVIAAYRKSCDEELDLHVGDEVNVTQTEGQYWRGSSKGKDGWFPATHVVEFAKRKEKMTEPDESSYQMVKEAESHRPNSSSSKVKVKGGHGDWRRQILGDLTVMNPKEMLEINRIIRGSGQRHGKSTRSLSPSSRTMHLPEANETLRDRDQPTYTSVKSKNDTPVGGTIKIEIDSPTQTLTESSTESASSTQDGRTLLNVKKPSTSRLKRPTNKKSDMPEWAKTFMDTHRPHSAKV